MDGPWPELKAKKMKKQNDQDLSELTTGIHSGISTGGTGHWNQNTATEHVRTHSTFSSLVTSGLPEAGFGVGHCLKGACQHCYVRSYKFLAHSCSAGFA